MEHKNVIGFCECGRVEVDIHTKKNRDRENVSKVNRNYETSQTFQTSWKKGEAVAGFP